MRPGAVAFWIHDLSSRDPYFVLPAIMAAAMFTQYKLNPAPRSGPGQGISCHAAGDVVHVRVLPAGLVLYWVTNTCLSILQQGISTAALQAVAAKKKT